MRFSQITTQCVQLDHNLSHLCTWCTYMQVPSKVRGLGATRVECCEYMCECACECVNHLYVDYTHANALHTCAHRCHWPARQPRAVDSVRIPLHRLHARNLFHTPHHLKPCTCAVTTTHTTTTIYYYEYTLVKRLSFYYSVGFPPPSTVGLHIAFAI